MDHRYPGRKDESWWLLVGNAEANTLLTIKKVSMSKASVKSTLKFEAPAQPGTHRLTLYFMCDAYMGCDQVSSNTTHRLYTCLWLYPQGWHGACRAGSVLVLAAGPVRMHTNAEHGPAPRSTIMTAVICKSLPPG